MKDSIFRYCAFLAMLSLLFGASARAATPVPLVIQNAPANSWIKLNTNHFSDAWAPDGLTPNNTKGVIEAWSSFAWDSMRGNIILWGGGHANYIGNEVYLWNSASGEWGRGSLPTRVVADPYVASRYETVDGPLHTPISMHTYDGNIYLPHIDRFLTFGGPAYNVGGPSLYDSGTLRPTGPYLWDPAKADPWKVGGVNGSHILTSSYPADSVLGGNMWQNRDSYPQGIPPGSDRLFGTNFSAYADENGQDVLYLSGGRSLWRYLINDLNDPSQDQYQLVGINDAGGHPHGSGTYDPTRRLWVELRGSDLQYYDLSGALPAIVRIFNNRIVYDSPADEGSFNFGSLVWPVLGDRYGIEYDAARDRYLLWEGINEIWELKAPADLANGNWVIKRLTPGSTGGIYPDRIAEQVLVDNNYNQYAFRGSAGKWKYIPEWDVFIGLYHPVQGDVWAYKPATAGLDCAAVLTPSGASVPGAGSIGSIAVQLPAGCAWTANSNDTWLTLTDGVSGNGSGNVSYSASVNNGPPRIGTLTIANTTFQVNQATDCIYLVSPSSIQLDPTAQSGSIEVTTSGTCQWTATSIVPWLTITSGTSGSGSGTIGFTVTANAGGERTVTLNVSNQIVVVTQAAGSQTTPPSTNVALQANGGVATASSQNAYPGYVVTAVNNGDRKGANCNTGGCWVDGTAGVWPDWVQVTFSGLQTIDRVEVFTLQDYWTAPVEPTAAMTFASYGVVSFEVQYWTGAAWATVPNGVVTGNNKVWRTITFPALTTDRIRVWITNALYNNSRITEIEAWTTDSAPANMAPTVSMTSPTNGASYTAPASVTLMAAAADSDGSVAKVEFYAGAIKLGEALSAPYTLTWSGVAAGSYSLTAVVTDNLGATATSTPVSIIVNATGNALPTVSMTSPTNGASYTAPASVTLMAAAADSDGSVAKVEFYAGAIKLGEALSAPYTLTWSGVAAGSYSLTAVVTDNLGATATSTPVSITVTGGSGSSINVALQANGGVATASSQNAYPGYVVTAVNNGDRKGANCNTGGCWVDGTAGVWPDWVQVTFSGLQTIDRVEVFTLQDYWTAPVEPTAAMTFASYGVVSFEVQYWTGAAWATVPNGVVTGNNKVWRTITFPALTTDRIRVWITNALYNNSRITEIEAWTTDSAPANMAPTVSMTSPTNGASYTAPASVTLMAAAADSDGSVAKVEFYAGAIKLGEALSAPYTLTWSGVAAGSYSLTAVVTDNLGATATSTPVSIIVNATGNALPTVSMTSPTNGASYTAPASVTLMAAAADSDGSVAKVEFYAGAIKLGEALSAPYTLTWSGVAAGSYSLTAVVTDNLGATATSTPVSITVTGGSGSSINVALQANGGVATASSQNAYPGYVVTAVNNGDRKGANCNTGGCWVDGTAGVWPDWVQVTFSGLQTIDRVEVFTLQDYWTAPVEPTAAMTFASYGVVSFEVQYWTGAAWATVPNGVVTGNNKVWRTITFPALTTDRIRVWITNALYNNSRITEIEAWSAE